MAVPNSARLARTSDVDDIARVQIRAWREAYRDMLPPEVLAGLDAEDIAWQWGRALLGSEEHRVFVAVAEGDGQVVGVASVGPTADPDLDPGTVGEIGALIVDPDHQRRGHASRLISACVDLLREMGRAECVVWVPLADEPKRALLQSAGWGPDSAFRDLETESGVPLREVRLVTVL